MDQQPYDRSTSTLQSHVPQEERGSGMAVASLVLGLVAMILLVPVVDLIAGILGIIFAVSVKRAGYRDYAAGMATAGLVVSIIGTLGALMFTAASFGWI